MEEKEEDDADDDADGLVNRGLELGSSLSTAATMNIDRHGQ